MFLLLNAYITFQLTFNVWCGFIKALILDNSLVSNVHFQVKLSFTMSDTSSTTIIVKKNFFAKEKHGSTIDEENGCWCKSIRPIIFVSQLIGNSPFTRNCCKSKSGECSILPKFCSLSSICNLIFLIGFAMIGSGLPVHGNTLMDTIITGTDGRIYDLQLGSMFVQDVTILLFARFNISSISKVWEIFRELASPTFLNFRPPKKFRCGIFILTSFLVASTIGFITCLENVVTKIDCSLKAYQNKTCNDMFSQNPILVGMVGFSGLIVSNSCILAATILAYALLIRLMSKKIAENLEAALMMESNRKGVDLLIFANPFQIEKLRRMHLSLQECVVHLREYYGIPCLIVCCGSVFQLSCGFYWLFLFSEGITTFAIGEGSIASIIICTLQSFYFSSLSLMEILIAGQIMTDSVSIGIYDN
jgi:hypothetical protein